MGGIAKIFGGGGAKPNPVTTESPSEIADRSDAIAASKLAEEKKKRRGFAATIATSSQGLGDTANSNVKTLLG